MMGRDRISELPDSLLTQILSYLSTKDSVRTSILSKRWEFMWLMVPGLDLDLEGDFPNCSDAFEIFIDKFLAFNRELRMQKFKLTADEQCDINFSPYRFGEWISSAVDLEILHLYVAAYIDFRMPQNIYTSDTLVSLKLVTVWMEDPQFVVSLPCLKIMYLNNIWYDEDSLIFEKLISGCPALEELAIFRPFDHWDKETILFLRVKSQSLKSFYLVFEHTVSGTDFSVEIEAPRLECLAIDDDQSDMIVVKNLTSLSMIEIYSDFNVEYGSPLDPENLRKRDIIRDFLTGVSSVRRMIIGRRRDPLSIFGVGADSQIR